MCARKSTARKPRKKPKRATRQEQPAERLIPLVGHERPKRLLAAALAGGRLGHAYLLVGEEGIGKRRFALHLAQSLFCTRTPPASLEPCGGCDDCRQVLAGTHPDLFQFAKPADRNLFPVEEIRAINEKAALKPARGRHKLLVVDDADLFNEAAANALLKTLEEPPDGTVLVLLGTSLERQLATIVSRCQAIGMQPLTDEQVAAVLVGTGTDAADASRLAAWSAGSVGMARQLAAPEWAGMRDRLPAALAALPDGARTWVEELLDFIDEAGKDAPAKRARTQQLFRLATLFYRQRLRGCCLAADAASPPWDEQALLDSIERCLAASYQLGRFVHQVLCVETWIDDLAQIAAGRHVPPVTEAMW